MGGETLTCSHEKIEHLLKLGEKDDIARCEKSNLKDKTFIVHSHLSNYTKLESHFVTMVRCLNCRDLCELQVKRGTPILKNQLRFVACANCNVRGKLVQLEWDGEKYVQI